jgi:hypothetical protein
LTKHGKYAIVLSTLRGISLTKTMKSIRSFLLLATTAAAALGLASPAKAGEFSLSVKDGSTEVFYHLGQNPSMEEFQKAKIQLQKMVRREVIRPQPTTATQPIQWGGSRSVAKPSNCDKPNGPRCQPLWGEPISFPSVD